MNNDFDTDENDEDEDEDEDEDVLCTWCDSVMFFSESDNCYLCPFCDMDWNEE